jgi:hypothetical protein
MHRCVHQAYRRHRTSVIYFRFNKLAVLPLEFTWVSPQDIDRSSDRMPDEFIVQIKDRCFIAE